MVADESVARLGDDRCSVRTFLGALRSVVRVTASRAVVVCVHAVAMVMMRRAEVALTAEVVVHVKDVCEEAAR